jgi:RHS repeat-associated protein
LDYFLARYYSSAQGRFTSPDEFTGGPDELYSFADHASENPTFYSDLFEPRSLNKYQYCHDNPLRYVDSDGHGIRYPFRSAKGKGPKIPPEAQIALAVLGGPVGIVWYLAEPQVVGAPSKDNPDVGNVRRLGDYTEGFAISSMIGMTTPLTLSEVHAQITRLAHARELGMDPARGSKYSPAEANTALRLESQVGRLRRDPTGQADWIGPGGRLYDAVGAGLKSKYFNYEAFTKSISEHLVDSRVNVVVDVRGLSGGQRFAVDRYIRGLDEAQKGRITILQ